MAVLGYALGAVLMLAAAVLGASAREDAAQASERWRACARTAGPAACGSPVAGWDVARLAMAGNALLAGLGFTLLGAGLRRGERLEAKLDRLAVTLTPGRAEGRAAEAPRRATEAPGAERMQALMAAMDPERVRQHAEVSRQVARMRGVEISQEEAERMARETLARRDSIVR